MSNETSRRRFMKMFGAFFLGASALPLIAAGAEQPKRVGIAELLERQAALKRKHIRGIDLSEFYNGRSIEFHPTKGARYLIWDREVTQQEFNGR